MDGVELYSEQRGRVRKFSLSLCVFSETDIN